ncbi:lipopolysaccharide assembly protein LapB [Pelagibius sp.]|uniref:tetratricopeptide repeat protein n=1 Tax=Pelagibius sp. TaxID=1931238 RepID=UPI0026208807|nr:tetratricopeptide repeat protein [Pelagibius sp.]
MNASARRNQSPTRTMVFRLFAAAAVVTALAAPAAPALAAGWSSNETTTAADKDYVQAEKHIEAGDYERAIAHLTKAAERQPKNADIFNYLGYTNRKLGNYDVALTHYQRALSLDPSHRGAHEYLGELYLTTGEIEKAEAQLSKLDSLCFFGCEEYRVLKAKIAEYKERQAALPNSNSSAN